MINIIYFILGFILGFIIAILFVYYWIRRYISKMIFGGEEFLKNIIKELKNRGKQF